MNAIIKLCRRIRPLGQDIFEEAKTGLRRAATRRPLTVLLLAYAGVLLILRTLGVWANPGENNPARWSGERIVLTGVVISHPDPRPKGTVYIIRAETIRSLYIPKSVRSVSGDVYLQVSGAPPGFISPLDRVEVIGKIHVAANPHIPGVFDYGHYLRNQGVYSQIFAGKNSVINLGPSRPFSIRNWGWTIHQRIVRTFFKYLKPESAAVLSGLTVGDRPRFFPEIKRIFVESGTMHILVASGSNVAFVVGFWFVLARLFLRSPRKWAMASAILGVWIYVLIVGGDPPILRAGLMATVAITAYLLKREDMAIHALTVAAWAILIISPRTLFDVGFQMSFATVLGLIYFVGKWPPFLWRTPIYLRWFILLAGSTVTAQIWLWPIAASVFKKFYPVSLVSNIVAIPMAAGGLTAGLILLLTHFVHSHILAMPFILSMVHTGASIYLESLIGVIKFFAEHPGKYVWLASPSWVWCAAYYVGCLTIVQLANSKLARALFVSALALMLLAAPRLFRPSTPGPASLIWLDVGKQNSLLIRSGHKHYLINPPEKDLAGAMERVVMPFLSERGVNKLEAVIFTHRPQDLPMTMKTLRKELTVIDAVAALDPRKKFRRGPLQMIPLPGAAKRIRETPVLLTLHDETILLSQHLSLTTQRHLAELSPSNINIIQSHWKENQIWLEEFLRKLKPHALVETGFDNSRQKSVSPWGDLKPVVPQKRGWFEWTISAPPSRKKMNGQKPG